MDAEDSRTRIGFNTLTKEATKRGSSTARIPEMSIRAVQGHTGGNLIALELMGHVATPYTWKECLFH